MNYTDRYLKQHLNCNSSVESLFKMADMEIEKLNAACVHKDDRFKRLKAVVTKLEQAKVLSVVDCDELFDI